MIRRENPAKIPVWEKNPLKYTTAYVYSSKEKLQVALWTYMFIRLGLNKERRNLCKDFCIDPGLFHHAIVLFILISFKASLFPFLEQVRGKL